MSSKLIAWLLLSFLSISTYGQEITISGKVVDSKTGEGIPYVSIGQFQVSRGTSSNEEGMFIVNIDSSSKELIFSHISYERKAIEVLNSGNVVVELTPRNYRLDAITVKGKKRQTYVETLVINAYEKALQNAKKEQYGKAFYRQKSQNDTIFSELYEIFYDIRSSGIGIHDWGIQEGRYAMNLDERMITNKNFTLLSRIMMPIQPNTEDFFMPIRPDAGRFYDFEVGRVLDVDGREVAELEFIPKPKLPRPAWQGKVYIDIDNHDILKVDGGFVDDRLKVIKITKDGYWKNYSLQYEMYFRRNKSSTLSLDYIKVDQSFDYFVEDQFQFPVQSSSILTVYEQYNPPKRKRLGGRINYRRSDASILDQLGYDRKFWEDNPILQRTPIEEEVIADFESSRAFGTIFLNDQKQIILEQKDLRKDPFIEELNSKFERSFIRQEKVYLHHDKPIYAAGEDIWYSIYLVDASTHFSDVLSDVVHVELIGPDYEIVSHQVINTQNGRGKGDIHLPDSIPQGKYWLRAYTQLMRNEGNNEFYFQEEIAILSEIEADIYPFRKIDSVNKVDFFPEGGYMISGITGQIAFKATDKGGKGTQISGSIENQSGKTVGKIKSNQFGYGSFYLNPQSDDSYRALIDFEGEPVEFDLGKILPTGIALQANNRNENTVKLVMRATRDFHEKSFYIIGQSRGRIVHRSKHIMTERGVLTEIPKSNLPQGILQITLFDELGRPRCERLVFIDTGRDPEVSINPDKDDYGPRNQVSLEISVKDAEGRGIEGDFSLSVTDGAQVRKDPFTSNIQNYFHLSSDIDDYVDSPGYYFGDSEKLTQRNLDLLMMTHGWRRFKWLKILEDPSPNIQYFPERGFTLTGLAVSPEDRVPLKNRFLNVVALSDSASMLMNVQTDDRGYLELRGLNFRDSSTLYFSIPGVKDQSRALDVTIRIPRSPPKEFHVTGRTIDDLMYWDEISEYLTLSRERQVISEASGPMTMMLDVVEVEGQREELSIADAVIRPEKREYTDVFQMIVGQVPGVVVSGFDNRTTIRFRNSQGPPLLILDGLPFLATPFRVSNRGADTQDQTGGPGSPPTQQVAGAGAFAAGNNRAAIEALLAIPPNEIEKIEIFKDASASYYGVLAANGVISVTTKKGIDTELRQKKEKVSYKQVQGFYTAREFSSPNYKLNPDYKFPDKRATLFWGGSIKTDKNGRAKITFFNSDNAKNIQLDLQGISDFGEPFKLLEDLIIQQ